MHHLLFESLEKKTCINKNNEKKTNDKLYEIDLLIQYFAFHLQTDDSKLGLPKLGRMPISGVALKEGVDIPED